MKIISFTNQKGGVGKTTLCLHTAGALVELGKRVLLVDMDSQMSLSTTLVKEPGPDQKTLADLFFTFGKYNLQDMIVRNGGVAGIDVLLSHRDLKDLDTRLVSEPDAQFFLREALESLGNAYDFVLIDCPPNLNLPTRVALVAAHGCVVPLQPERYAFESAEPIVGLINRVRERANKGLKLLGFVINLFNPRLSEAEAYISQLVGENPGIAFETVIHKLAPYTYAITAGLPVTHFSPSSEASQTIRLFVKELMDKV